MLVHEGTCDDHWPGPYDPAEPPLEEAQGASGKEYEEHADGQQGFQASEST